MKKKERFGLVVSHPLHTNGMLIHTFTLPYVLFGKKDQLWLPSNPADPSLAVGIPPRVVDESAKATRVLRCVDAPTLPVIFEVVDIRALQKKINILVNGPKNNPFFKGKGQRITAFLKGKGQRITSFYKRAKEKYTERAWVPVVLHVSKRGSCHGDELSGIFHPKIAFLKRSGCSDAAALGAVIANFKALCGIGPLEPFLQFPFFLGLKVKSQSTVSTG